MLHLNRLSDKIKCQEQLKKEGKAERKSGGKKESCFKVAKDRVRKKGEGEMMRDGVH